MHWGNEKAKRVGKNEELTQYDSNQGRLSQTDYYSAARLSHTTTRWMKNERDTRLGPRLKEVQMTLEGCYLATRMP